MTEADLSGLDRAELAPLWAAARRRLERSGLELGTSALLLRDLSVAERDAIAGLLGEPPVPTPLPVRVSPARLDAVLRSGRAGAGLAEVVTALSGPLRDRRAERANRTAASRSLWEAAAAHPAVGRHPELRPWLAGLRRLGLVSRLGGDDPAELLTATLDVLRDLPAEPPQLLAVLAARVLGDAHGLDADRATATLVVRALAHLADQPTPTTSEERRHVLSGFGVTVDELSARVLVLGVEHPAIGSADEPAWLTLRALRRTPVTRWGARLVRVCENPAVVAAAADQFGEACGPLVCTNGVPDAAFHELARQAVAAGRELAVHADFDVGGVRIAASVMARTGARPWRFGVDDYRQVAARGLPTLSSQIPATPWSPRLAAEMRRSARAVHEEAVIDVLLHDLT